MAIGHGCAAVFPDPGLDQLRVIHADLIPSGLDCHIPRKGIDFLPFGFGQRPVGSIGFVNDSLPVGQDFHGHHVMSAVVQKTALFEFMLHDISTLIVGFR